MSEMLKILAGRSALAHIRERGLKPEDVRVIAGAAGGPKWLVLNGLDRYLFSFWLKGRATPLFLVGSSIGAWRFAAVAQNDPQAALDRLETAYIHQRYEKKPTPREVTRESQKIMDSYLDERTVQEVLDHPYLRLNIMAVQCLGAAADDHQVKLALGLVGAALCNAIHRNFLKMFFRRALFFNPRNLPPFMGMDQFPIQNTPLDHRNLKPALMASGSIPLVMSGIRNIPGVEKGTYRDGGVIDYHLDIPFLKGGVGIVLYPHYMPRIIPGWLDKKMTWRRPNPQNMSRVLLVAPSDDFVKQLPYGKISDRNDFWLFKNRDQERFVYWKTIVKKGQQLAEAFHEAVESGRIRQMVEPLK
jgi:hypothetical protein